MSKIIKIKKLSKEESNSYLGEERDTKKFGFMFIVPNHTRKASEYDNKRAEALVNLYGCSLAEPMVQIWTHNADQDNWSDHGDPYNRTFQHGLREDLFPNVFPKSFFEGMKEGDIISLDMEDEDGQHHIQHIVLRQKGYRYESFGDFEEVLEKI